MSKRGDVCLETILALGERSSLIMLRAFRKPVFVTLQGEELFLDSLASPYREQSLALIRSHIDAVDGFIAVSEYFAEFMRTYLGIPATRISASDARYASAPARVPASRISPRLTTR